MEVKERINRLRELMQKMGITAYVVPTSDPHQSEYIADYYKTRVWISGFTGSAGTVAITQKEAILWTDGRYFIQAEKELGGSGIKLYRIGIPGFPTYSQWLKDSLNEGDTIGFDGRTFSQKEYESLEKEISKKKIKIVDDYDLIGEIWVDRPALPQSTAFVHDVKYAGKPTKEKLEEVRKEMANKEATHFLIGSLDDIAWLYNIRGRDIPKNPVIISYALISEDNAFIFVNENKINEKVTSHLKENGVEIKEYDKIVEEIENIPSGSKVFLDPSKINRWLYKKIPEHCEIVKGTNITTYLKSIKNEVEIKNQKNAYIKDGVALVKFMYWLDKNIGKTKITEASASKKLEDFRRQQEGFIEPSFDTIAAYKENAAMMHYKPEEGKSNYELKNEKMFLVDSGGQYLDGTTDITRTIILGPITDEEKRDFTLTLKAHINLISSKFLYGSTGTNLDALARYPLWQEGLDYKCGTGHGVGFLLNVHEGPQSISNKYNEVVLEKGMILTIEPGVYKEGKHGVRIENVTVVEEDITTDSGKFMRFQPLSFCPIDLKGIDVTLLTIKEKKWLNEYHKQVFDKLSPYLEVEEKEWLKENTKSI